MTINPNSNCSRCGKKSLLTDEVTGEQFCGKCGYVISEKVDESGPKSPMSAFFLSPRKVQAS